MQAKLRDLSRRFFVPSSRRNFKFLVLLPIHRSPNLLKFAVASVLNQTEQDYQLHLISDGAPDETTQELHSLAKREGRITSHIFAKGQGHGEVYRNSIIREARADIICQIADDDIWFPNHLYEIAMLLENYDFGNTIQTQAAPGRMLMPLLGDISDLETANRMLNQRFNLFGPTASGYRKDAYLKLEDGWTAAPEDIWSDLHMWRKFLAHDEICCGTRFSFTNIQIAAALHADISIEQREEINRNWWSAISKRTILDHIEQGLTKHSFLAGEGDSWYQAEL